MRLWLYVLIQVSIVVGFNLKKNIRRSHFTPVRVRFAPSPTGSLHVGGARTALYNWLLARKTGGSFIVRVEDTDVDRSTKASETSILNDLKWLNLQWDEGPGVEGPHGPYRQSERLHIYKKYADQLMQEGKAYKCFCTEKELEEKKLAAEAAGVDPKYDGTWRNADPEEVRKRSERGDLYTVRFRVPSGKIVSVNDKVRGRVNWDADACLGDFIILRSSGMPVYNFCVSVDDMDMQITHVVRAEEHLSNTLRQLLILEALNYKPPTYAHCSLILGSDKSKLSKRHGATSVSQFSEQGFVPAAMNNYLANLGWNDGTAKEIYTPDELIHAFSLNRIVKSSAVFDMDKLRWINGQHLRIMPLAELQPYVLSRLCAPSKNNSAPPPPTPGTNVSMVPSILLPAANSILSEQKYTNDSDVMKFLAVACKIAQREMDLTVESSHLVGICLHYDLRNTLATDAEEEALFKTESFQSVLKALVRDFENGVMPSGVEDDFDDKWKDYCSALGKECKAKGKDLYHPIRVCLTGRKSGPELNLYVRLAALTDTETVQSIVNADFGAAGLKDRVAQLKDVMKDYSM